MSNYSEDEIDNMRHRFELNRLVTQNGRRAPNCFSKKLIENDRWIGDIVNPDPRHKVWLAASPNKYRRSDLGNSDRPITLSYVHDLSRII